VSGIGLDAAKGFHHICTYERMYIVARMRGKRRCNAGSVARKP